MRGFSGLVQLSGGFLPLLQRCRYDIKLPARRQNLPNTKNRTVPLQQTEPPKVGTSGFKVIQLFKALSLEAAEYSP